MEAASRYKSAPLQIRAETRAERLDCQLYSGSRRILQNLPAILAPLGRRRKRLLSPSSFPKSVRDDGIWRRRQTLDRSQGRPSDRRHHHAVSRNAGCLLARGIGCRSQFLASFSFSVNYSDAGCVGKWFPRVQLRGPESTAEGSPAFQRLICKPAGALQRLLRAEQ